MKGVPSKNVSVATVDPAWGPRAFAEVELNLDRVESRLPILVAMDVRAPWFIDSVHARELGHALILAADAVEAPLGERKSRFCPRCKRMVRVSAAPGEVLLFVEHRHPNCGASCEGSREPADFVLDVAGVGVRS